MTPAAIADLPVGPDEPILVTGAAGFIGRRVVATLQARGFRNIRGLTRRTAQKPAAQADRVATPVELIQGNLLSRADCERAVKGARIIYHLAAGTGQKSFADAYLNSVVTTRNLIEAGLATGRLLRFVNVSSFAVYSNRGNRQSGVLDESGSLRDRPDRWGDAYCYAKMKQDELVMDYGEKHGLSWVILRPGAVFGPGKPGISARVGIDPFGIFLHLGGDGQVPLTYVDNCADAIVLAGLRQAAERQVFNVVDDELPTSRHFLRQYKRQVRSFRSVYVPSFASYLLCWLWERGSVWSHGQLPPNYNRGAWHAYWKPTRYSNEKLRKTLGWAPQVPMREAMRRYFDACREREARHA